MFGRVIWDKLPECICTNFKIFKNHEGDLSEKCPESNMWLLVNHIKPTNTFIETNVFTAGNCKSASGKLQNSGQLQSNSVNGAMLIIINRVIKHCKT